MRGQRENTIRHMLLLQPILSTFYSFFPLFNYIYVKAKENKNHHSAHIVRQLKESRKYATAIVGDEGRIKEKKRRQKILLLRTHIYSPFTHTGEKEKKNSLSFSPFHGFL